MEQKIIIKRDGHNVPFDSEKIKTAVTNAFLKNEHGVVRGTGELGQSQREKIDAITNEVVSGLFRHGNSERIESIQDRVELCLMRSGEHEVARGYVLYRAARETLRQIDQSHRQTDSIQLEEGLVVNQSFIESELKLAISGLEVQVELVAQRTIRELYNGATIDQYQKAKILACRSLIEQHPDYSKLTARIALDDLYGEVLGEYRERFPAAYRNGFKAYIKKGLSLNALDEKLGRQFDLTVLSEALEPTRDGQFDYLGYDTLYDRYFLHENGNRYELPQYMFMRVAMGLALNEPDCTEKAIEFYNLLSSFDFMSSTPTLFNSGTMRPQLSSCYLTTIADDLDAIYDGIKENALLAKYAGGLGNDWTPVRAMGTLIKGTNGKSQGIVPFLKVVNDTAVAVNQGGKRKGAVCAYVETWHLDIEEFLELRKNTGDDRRRTHDMNTANWIPDLFMKRVMDDGEWTLFTPSEVPDLHELYGQAFERAYVRYEEKAAQGEIKLFKKVSATTLWRKMLSMIFETGHPWITFKDPCNIRSPQQHVGVVHSSNLCTEITLNTSETETAVCNLGSVNLVKHMVKDENGQYVLDTAKLANTVKIAMRMLDNVIDINYYNSPKARHANLKHRPVGLGQMGFHDCLQLMGVPYASAEAVKFAGTSQEAIAYYAYLASSELAAERGRYSSYKGSLWDQGILPQDSVAMLAKERGLAVEVTVNETMDWSIVRESIRQHGMRNSNCLAIAPTATISNIVCVSAAIDPIYQNLYTKSNLGGEYTEVNPLLVQKLTELGIWDEVMVADLKFFDGSCAKIERIPSELRQVFATAFEIEPTWLIQSAKKRQVWVDQGQSLNLYLVNPSGKKIHAMYMEAWLAGLKTTYYLRTLAATSAEKSTGKGGELNAVSASVALPEPEIVGRVCTLRPGDAGYEECEACQ